MIEYEIIPSLQIIDGFEKRQKREFPKLGNESELKVDNPAAEITLESIEIIKKAGLFLGLGCPLMLSLIHI